jgi:hypothetical protein
MKLRIFACLFCLATLVCACSDDDEPSQTNTIPVAVESAWGTLRGTYSTTFYVLKTENVWYTETITFKPYSERKVITPIFTSEKGTVYAYGEADIVDTRYVKISGTSKCYYSLNAAYDGAPLTISFYQYATDSGESWGSEDKRNIKNITSNSFSMWGYGLTETENSHIYAK